MANEHSQGVVRKKYNRCKIVHQKDKTAEIKNQLERNATSTALMLESPRLERHFNAAYQPRDYYRRVTLMAMSIFIVEWLATVQGEVNLRSSPKLPFDIPPGGPKPSFKPPRPNKTSNAKTSKPNGQRYGEVGISDIPTQLSTTRPSPKTLNVAPVLRQAFSPPADKPHITDDGKIRARRFVEDDRDTPKTNQFGNYTLGEFHGQWSQWAAYRPSNMTTALFTALPTNEAVFRAAIENNGDDPNEIIDVSDTYTTDDVEGRDDNTDVPERKTRLELALEARVTTFPFITRKHEEIYLPDSELFEKTYNEYIARAKEIGLNSVFNKLKSMGATHRIGIRSVTALHKTIHPPSTGTRGAIVSAIINGKVRYIAVAPLDEDTAFLIPESENLNDWIKRHRHLFFNRDFKFSAVDRYITKVEEVNLTSRKAAAKIVYPIVEEVTSSLKPLAYGETSLENFIHTLRGFYDRVGAYGFSRAVEARDGESLALSLGAEKIPYASDVGKKIIKLVPKGMGWVKNFVKTIKQGLTVTSEGEGLARGSALDARDLQIFKEDEPAPQLDIEQILAWQDTVFNPPAEIVAEADRLYEIVNADAHTKSLIAESDHGDPLDTVKHVKHMLHEKGYKTEILAMLTWGSSKISFRNRPNKHFVVLARKHGHNHYFAVDATANQLQGFNMENPTVKTKEEWLKLVHDKAEIHAPDSIIKFRTFNHLHDAINELDQWDKTLPTSFLGENTKIIYAPKKYRKALEFTKKHKKNISFGRYRIQKPRRVKRP